MIKQNLTDIDEGPILPLWAWYFEVRVYLATR